MVSKPPQPWPPPPSSHQLPPRETKTKKRERRSPSPPSLPPSLPFFCPWVARSLPTVRPPDHHLLPVLPSRPPSPPSPSNSFAAPPIGPSQPLHQATASNDPSFGRSAPSPSYSPLSTAPFRTSPSILLNPLPPNPALLPIKKMADAELASPSCAALCSAIYSTATAAEASPLLSVCAARGIPTTSVTSPPPWTNTYNLPAYCPIRALTINAPTQTNAIILAPVPQPLLVPRAIPPYDFETATKRVSSPATSAASTLLPATTSLASSLPSPTLSVAARSPTPFPPSLKPSPPFSPSSKP